ncbi:MFS transporter [Metabacillus fastidiosus]|uniref:MFS transporter n=1 Tax=Metabacillus fastidiosus TaxID=1458 RepID=UPI003D26CD3A
MKFASFFIAVFFVLASVSAVRPMTSLFAKELDASMIEIGIITVCYSVTPLFLAVFAGRYIDRFGEKLPIIAGSICMFISLALPFYFPSIATLYISMLLLGGGQLLAILAIQNGVTKSASNETRDKAVGTLSLFTSTGLLFGPLIGGYVSEHFGFQTSYILLAVIPVITIIVSFFVAKIEKGASKEKQGKSANVKELLLLPGLGRSIFVSMLILSSLDIYSVYFPLYGQSIGLSVSQIGWVLAVQGAASALVRIIMPKLVEAYGRVTILWIFMGIGALAYGFIPFQDQFSIILIISFIIGAGLGITLPLTIILSYNAAPPGRSGEVLGLRLASNRLAQTVVPFLLAYVSSFVGLGIIFVIKSVLLLSGSLTARGISDDVQEVEEDEREKAI